VRAVGSVESTVQSNDVNNIVRPRAPRTRLPNSSIEGIKPDSKAKKVSGCKEGRQKRKAGAKSANRDITELWDSLNHFSTNNMSRMVRLSDSSLSPDDIHYINITEDSAAPKVSGKILSLAPGSSTSIERGGRFMSRNIPIESLRGDVTHAANTEFCIPELPRGKVLTLNILSTWGDPHYLGLMGIEIFDKSGHLVHLSNPSEQIWANPADINVLPEYENDPRTVDNLLDGVNHTCDDLHAWLTPFTAGQDHLITIEFDEETTVSMIRVWNYNKSRIHSYRGARYVEISLDSCGYIFKGEIKRAIGSHYATQDVDACSECILFTRNERM
jgi:protein JBTS26